MAEEAIFPFRAIFSLISIGALAVVIVVFVWLFINTIIKVHDNELDRAALHVRDVILTGNLTRSLAVFNRAMLDRYDPLDSDPSIDEPYARHCSYGYRLVIETLTDDVNKKGKWEFGYKPDSYLDSSVVDSYVSIYDDAEDSVIPAKMKLTLYDTWATRISCLVDKAYRSGEVQHMGIPCIEIEAMPIQGSKTFTCRVEIEKNVNEICSIIWDKIDCRYMDIPLKNFGATYFIEGDEKKTLKAIPIKSEAVADLPERTSICNLLNNDWIAAEGDNIGMIVLCLTDFL